MQQCLRYCISLSFDDNSKIVAFKNSDERIGVVKILIGGGPNHKSHAMTSPETSKEEFLWGQKYRRMEN